MQTGVGFSLAMSPGRTICRGKRDGSRVYRTVGERYIDSCVRERNQYGGGSIMIWAGISLHTKTPMAPIHPNLSAARYKKTILQPVAILHIKTYHETVLKQDNTTPHAARTNTVDAAGIGRQLT